MPTVPAISPWPFADSRPVVLVGGTFDPPHRAHVRLAARVRDLVEPGAALLFVPAAESPFKAGQATTSAEHRLAMLRLALATVPNAAVWTDELDRRAPGTPSYTVETLRRARAVAPGTRIRLLLGADQAAQFHRWKDAREVLELAPPIVVLRTPFETGDDLERAILAAGCWSPQEIARWRGAVCDPGAIDPASSTGVRDAIRNGGIAAVPEGWLEPAVRRYIGEQGLYRDGRLTS